MSGSGKSSRVTLEIFGKPAQVSVAVHEYLQGIASVTRRSIEYRPLSEIAVQVGIASVFKRDPAVIAIELSEELVGQGDRLEHALCHEATHGLLTYKLGYHHPRALSTAPQGTVGRASLLATLLDDLVVNQRLAELGLIAYLPSYIANVKKETAALRAGKDEAPKTLGPTYHSKFKVYKYVTAWGCAHLWGSSIADKKILLKLLRQLAASFPAETEEARAIIGLLDRNDLQTVEGHLTALRACCQLWGLSEHVELVSEAADSEGIGQRTLSS